MPFPPNRLNAVTIVHGQTAKLQVIVKTAEGRAYSLVGAKLFMSVRKAAGAPIVVAKTSDDGITITDQNKGIVEVTLTSEDTAKLDTGAWKYDVWVEFPGAPPVRYPVVSWADLHVLDSVTAFS